MDFAIIKIIISAYLLGSIPFGVILARLFKLPDPRTIGSGNIGATNMLRTGNKKVALLTLLLDAGKGALAVLATYHFYSGRAVAQIMLVPNSSRQCYELPFWVEGSGLCGDAILNMKFAAIALACAALGHMISPWLKFSGGKGFATLLGGSLAFSFPIGLTCCSIWLLVLLATRYVALASIITLIAMPIAIACRIDITPALIIGAACAYAIYKHRSNIARLRSGTEPKIQFGSKKA